MKSMLPPKNIPELRHIDGKARHKLSKNELKLIEQIERQSDKEFAAVFSNKKMLDYGNRIFGLLSQRGWKMAHEGWEKKGVVIPSLKSYEVDHKSAAAWRAYNNMEELSSLVTSADSSVLRQLRIAFTAGLTVAESKVIEVNLLGGRKKNEWLNAEIAKIIDSERTKTRTKDIHSALEKIHGKAVPYGKAFENRVSAIRLSRK